MHLTNPCLNCGNLLQSTDRFCAQCSQKNFVKRLTLANISHELVHAFTHADHSLVKLLKELARRPGLVALEYIEGKRKRYFNPFSFFVICIAFFVLMNSVFQAYGPMPQANPQVLSGISTEAGKAQYLILIERQADVFRFMQKNTNILTMIAVPLFSLISYLLLRKKKLNYAEHLLANLLFISFSNLIFTLLAPLMGLFAGKPAFFVLLSLALLLQTVYLAWAHYQLQQPPSKKYFLKTFGSSLLAIIIWNIITSLAMMIYILRSETWEGIKRIFA